MAPSDHDPEVGSLSDAALVQQTLPLASHFGCSVALAAALVSLVCGFGFGPRVGLGVLAVTASLAALAQRWRSHSPRLRRARAAEHEFQRRFGGDPLTQHLADARAQLAADTDLELLGLFRGRMLPHGGLRSIRLEISAQPKLVVRVSPPLASLQRGSVSSLALVRRESPLSAAQVERARLVLRELSGEPLAPLASFVVDGFPCEASVLQQSGAELHASANLAGLPDQLKRHPSVRLIELFLELEAELFSHSALA